VDLLKSAHHGSKTSSSHRFLQGAKPEMVAISCRLANKFKNPSPGFWCDTGRGDKGDRTDLNSCPTCRVNGTGIRVGRHLETERADHKLLSAPQKKRAEEATLSMRPGCIYGSFTSA